MKGRYVNQRRAGKSGVETCNEGAGSRERLPVCSGVYPQHSRGRQTTGQGTPAWCSNPRRADPRHAGFLRSGRRCMSNK